MIRGGNRAILASAIVAPGKVVVNSVDNKLEGVDASFAGIHVFAASGAVAEAHVSGTFATRYAQGIFFNAPSPSRLTISGNNLTNNDRGIQAPGSGAILSLGNNFIQGNRIANVDVATPITNTGGN